MKKVILFIFFYFLFFSPSAVYADNFFVKEEFDAFGRKSVTADAVYSGTKSLFFVEREYYNFLPANEVLQLRAAIEYLLGEFDNKIYPKMREVFGHEQSPPPGGDDKIKIVLHRMAGGVGGYTQEAESRTLYISVSNISDRVIAPAYLAHEFQHLITFNEKNIRVGLEEEQWLNEARSEYAPTLVGYNSNYKGSYLEKRVNEFLAHPSDALLDWRGRSIDHAAANMFIHYLVDRFGSGILKEMIGANSAGAQSINDALFSLGYKEGFLDAFKDWVIAIYINSSLEGEEKFSYKTQNLSLANLRVLPTTTFRVYDNYSSGASFVIDNWSGQWHRFIPGAVGEDTTLHIRITAPYKEGFMVRYVVSDFFGGSTVKDFDVSSASIISIDNFGREVSSVVVVPIYTKLGEANNSLSMGYSLEGFISNEFVSRFAEGALVRAKGDSKVYIVKNGPKIGEVFMRWIQTPEVFNFYKHFTWNDIIEVNPELLVSFRESFLISKAGDYRVYEVTKAGQKKWLDMNPQEFEAAGYSWDAVYEVNEAEFEWYK